VAAEWKNDEGCQDVAAQSSTSPEVAHANPLMETDVDDPPPEPVAVAVPDEQVQNVVTADPLSSSSSVLAKRLAGKNLSDVTYLCRVGP